MQHRGNNAIEELDVNFFREDYDVIISNTNDFIANVKERNLLPFDKLQVYYLDDYWDLSGFKATNVDNAYFRFDFSKTPECFREDLKNFVLISIIEERKKIAGVHEDFRQLCKFMEFCVKLGVLKVQYIEAYHVREWINYCSSDVTERYRGAMVNSIRNFCKCFDANFSQLFSKNFYCNIDSIVDSSLIKAEAANSRTPDIPTEYFDKTIAAAIATIDDEEAPAYYRALSCMILMDSQIGLRTGEVFDLKVGCVNPITIFTGDMAYYVEYKTWKRHHGILQSSMEISFVNSLFLKGYDSILEISKKNREELKTDLLFVEKKDGTATAEPVTPNSAFVHMNNLFRYYDKYFETIYHNEQDVTGLSCINLSKRKKPSGPYLLRPTITQFRVHVCSELYEKGCPIEYVEKFMSHLSAEMAYYYVRPKNTVQENLKESTRILREMVTKEALPIGATKGLIEKIDEFIAENNFSVEKDIDIICAKLAERIPIRIKSGGVCIKSSRFRECNKDALTDEFYCAYDVCPNIYTFYYMADISYLRIKDLCEAIEINKKRGCVKQVQKNINMIHSIVKAKLEPQLEDMKRVLEEKGVNYVLERHPQLLNIIMNLDDIQKEMMEWKNMSA